MPEFREQEPSETLDREKINVKVGHDIHHQEKMGNSIIMHMEHSSRILADQTINQMVNCGRQSGDAVDSRSKDYSQSSLPWNAAFDSFC